MPLPRDDTAFFGREAELADLDRRLDEGVRLLTIVGLAGIGKSRLAHVAAERFGRRAGRPVFHAALEGARSFEAAVRTVARGVGVRLAPSARARAAADVLGKALAQEGPGLLVLEHPEALGTAARDLVSTLLDAAPDLTVLATSRSDLGLRGEERLVLGPLEPAAGAALFLDRARAATAGAVAIPDSVLEAILVRTDLLPLAIELAAARLSVLSPAELAARLGKLDVLVDRSGRPDRQGSMRAALDDSWELLDARERAVLARASVFAAPFGLDAAAELLSDAAAAARECDVGADDVVDVLERLLEKSLLVRADGVAAARASLTMYRTVQRWAQAKLDDLGEREVTEARHARVL